MSLYAIDTQVLQYLLDETRQRADQAEEMAQEVRAWFEEIASDDHEIVISTLVMGEFLAGQPQEQHQNYVQMFRSFWKVLPYNDVAAWNFGRLRARHIREMKGQVLNEIRQQRAEGQVTRQGLSVDMMILAHAIAAGVNVFYTLNDKDFRKIAIGEIVVERPVPRQRRLI